MDSSKQPALNGERGQVNSGLPSLPRSSWPSEVTKLKLILQTKQRLDRKYGSST